MTKPDRARRPRWVKARVGLFIFFVLIVASWQPIDAHMRAKTLLARFGGLEEAPEESELTEEIAAIPHRGGHVRARRYVRRDGHQNGSILLVHGMHRLGIEEPRLVRFSRSLAAAGVRVVTPEVVSLSDYRVSDDAVETIRDGARWLAERDDVQSVGVVGISFAGGLSLVAAADSQGGDSPIGFVVSVGGHHSLERVLQFLASGQTSRPDGSSVAMKPHDYGLAVLLYTYGADVFAPPDADRARVAVRHWLHDERDEARAISKELSSPNRERLEALFAAKTDNLRKDVLVALEKHTADLERASPAGKLDRVGVPVFLLHGSGDSVVPPTESEWIAAELGSSRTRDLVVTPLLDHVEMKGKPPVVEQWELLHFMAEVLAAADGER